MIGHVGGWALTNLTASAFFDLGNQPQQLDIRQIQLAFPETVRAFNRLQLRGQLNRFNPDDWRGQCELDCVSLDLASLLQRVPGHDLPSPSDSATGEEPAPFIPAPAETTRWLKQLTSEVRIGQVFFHELNLSNWSAHVALDRDHVAIRADTGWLNGGPLALEAGFDVRTNLTGTLKLALTNANLTSPYFHRFFLPIGDVLHAPELASSPVTALALEGITGEGQVELKQCRLRGVHFIAETQGTFTSAQHILDSTIGGWPMRLAIRRDLAERAKLLPTDAPQSASYIFLPTFIRVSGTWAEPSPELDPELLHPTRRVE
jgi:hypothetical protein